MSDPLPANFHKMTHCYYTRYEIMLSCWNEEVTKRPSFKDLQTTLDHLLAAESNNTYIDFSIDPENLCYQVADEVVPPSSNGLLHTETRSSKQRSRFGSRPGSDASNKVTPSSSSNCLEDSQPSPPRRYARTPSPTIEKPHVTNLGGESREESRRPRSMMLLWSSSATPADDDR